MGKASRTKRERHSAPSPVPTRRRFPVFWIAVTGLVLAGVATLALTAPDDRERAAKAVAAKVPAFSEVTKQGNSLPTWTGSGSDKAKGQVVPSLSGANFDGDSLNLTPRDEVARVYVVVAHWCPHCQDEVPRIVSWSKDHQLPEKVEIVGVSTAVSDSQDNYPPAEWLAREEWPYDVLIDDEVATAAGALGVEGFPFLVFADSSGKVVQRFSGEMPIDEFDAAVTSLAATAKK